MPPFDVAVPFSIGLGAATADHNPPSVIGTAVCMRTRLRKVALGARAIPEPCISARTGAKELLVTLPCHTSDQSASSNWLSPHAGTMISPVVSSTCASACRSHTDLAVADNCDAWKAPPSCNAVMTACGMVRASSSSTVSDATVSGTSGESAG